MEHSLLLGERYQSALRDHRLDHFFLSETTLRQVLQQIKGGIGGPIGTHATTHLGYKDLFTPTLDHPGHSWRVYPKWFR